MKFYLARTPDGRPIWGKRKDEAAKLDKGFEQLEVDTSQDGLIERFQAYEDELFELRAQLAGVTVAAPEPEPVAAPEPDPVPALPPPPAPAAEPQDDGIMGMNATQLAPIVEQAVERLGELGEEGFEAVDSYHGMHGVGGSFSRGVHILSVLCMGEHQLTRLLFRSRKQKVGSTWGR